MGTNDAATVVTPPLEGISARVDEFLRGIDAEERAVRAAQGRQLRAVDGARRYLEAQALPEGVGEREAREFALRSFTAELATTLRVHENTALTLIHEARLLIDRFPATLAALQGARIGMRHVRELLQHALCLPDEVATAFEAEALERAVVQTPARFAHTARRLSACTRSP